MRTCKQKFIREKKNINVGPRGCTYEGLGDSEEREKNLHNTNAKSWCFTSRARLTCRVRMITHDQPREISMPIQCNRCPSISCSLSDLLNLTFTQQSPNPQLTATHHHPPNLHSLLLHTQHSLYPLSSFSTLPPLTGYPQINNGPHRGNGPSEPHRPRHLPSIPPPSGLLHPPPLHQEFLSKRSSTERGGAMFAAICGAVSSGTTVLDEDEACGFDGKREPS